MKVDQETYERYLNGDMNEREAHDFEEMMLADPELKKEVELHRSVHDLLSEKDVVHLDDTLSRISDSYREENKRAGLSKFWYMAAAAVLVLIAAYLGFVGNESHVSNKELFDTYFESYPSDNTTRSEEDSAYNEGLRKALRYYDQKQIDLAIQELEALLVLNDRDLRISFYLGVSNLMKSDVAASRKYFEKVISQNTSVFLDPANWYLGLTFLKEGDVKKAKEYFSVLKENAKGKYQRLASDILDSLN